MKTGFTYGAGLPARWAAELAGHEFDLADLAHLLAGQDPAAVKVGDKFYLTGSDLDARATATDVHRAASELLEMINGLAPALCREFRPVSVAACIRNPGERSQSVVVAAGTATVRLRARATAKIYGPDGKEKPDPTTGSLGRILDAARGDSLVERAAIFLNGRETSWFDLYKVIEVIEEDLGCAVSKAGLCSRKELSRFSGTANNFSVLGKKARHAKSRKQLPADPMSFATARAFVLDLLEAWLARKTSGGIRRAPVAPGAT